ncbi:hypothetical protein BDY21DRAFT_331844 [Lineolata rhizophorae]|uniref:Uncharacterized protein n=1 Tax=Lineolata rhizophorae TaxID=578093 RepID=A0A6A6PBL3_9PEZI|nr:hypothetical protein BDY21DRAFT_331844 [Lineolata rhizophorae]
MSWQRGVKVAHCSHSSATPAQGPCQIWLKVRHLSRTGIEAHAGAPIRARLLRPTT